VLGFFLLQNLGSNGIDLKFTKMVLCEWYKCFILENDNDVIVILIVGGKDFDT
jgi:hypothetical protein